VSGDDAEALLGRDSLTPIRAFMITSHEMFREAVASGFTEEQALSLLAKIFVAQGREDTDG